MTLGPMKKLFNVNKKDIPLYISSFVFLIVLILWRFPSVIGVTKEPSSIFQFRTDLKDLASIFYYIVTLWLVLVTRKMADISINAQKAMNRPEIMCELYISSEKPTIELFNGVKNVELRNTADSSFNEGLKGASVFLIIKNRYGGGKSINLIATVNLEAQNPERIKLTRTIEIDYLAEGDCVAVYLYRFEKPSIENCSIKLIESKLRFTTPFNEASKDSPIEIKYNNDKQILATGNHIGAIVLNGGIRTND